jgi:hypothetical protein
MSKLAIFNYDLQEIIILNVSDEQEEKFFNVYEENTYDWLCEEGIDEKLGFSVNSIDYMWFEDDETIRYESV